MIPSEYGSSAPTSSKSLRTRYETTRRPPSNSCARSSARASSFSFANCTVSYTWRKIPCTSAPASTSSAARRSAFGVVFVYWNRPVSVTRATYSASAMSGVSPMASSPSRSRTISAVDDASGTIRLTSPKRLLSWWWSTSITSRARARRLWSGPSRSSFAQSSASRTSCSMSSGTSRRTSPSGRKRYSPGSGPSPGRNICASLSSPRSASAIARIERSASATARSSVCVIGSVVDEFVDQLRHANPALDGRIVFEREPGCPPQAQLAGDPPLQEAVRRLQAGERRATLALVAEHGHEDAALAQVGRDLDAGDRHEADPRVLEIRDRVGDDCAHRLVDATHPLTHRHLLLIRS